MNYKNQEDVKLLSLINGSHARILDVGCGLGRYLIPLTAEGHEVIGVDKNPDIVNYLREKGYTNVYTIENAMENIPVSFDYIIMSHIIEHIHPDDFVSFFNHYLNQLKVGGHLIIATPSFHKRFFDDYDHIKPYTPKTFTLLFSDYEQFQEKPNHRLQLEYVWFRRDPIEYNSYPGDNINRQKRIRNLNNFFVSLYKISKQGISETTGWIGVFSRTS